MASVAMLVGGAILNATTFVGGSYLARYLSDDSSKDILYEKERHDKVLENTKKIMLHIKRRGKSSLTGKMKIDLTMLLLLVTLQTVMRL